MTEEEFNEQLAEKARQIKLDIQAGRYRNGQLQPDVHHRETTVTGRMSHNQWMDEMLHALYGSMSMESERRNIRRIHDSLFGVDYAQLEKRIYGHTPEFVIHDECRDFDWSSITIKNGDIKEPDWKKTRFESGPETPPSTSKRVKLRAKRKKRK